jgi:hypothetical protein
MNTLNFILLNGKFYFFLKLGFMSSSNRRFKRNRILIYRSSRQIIIKDLYKKRSLISNYTCKKNDFINNFKKKEYNFFNS